MLESASMKQILNPFWIVVFLVIIAVLAVFGLPENIAAYIICLFFMVIVILSPANGIYFLLLVTPFFLGNSKRPYYLMLEFFVYATILSAIFHWFTRRKEMATKTHVASYAYPVLLFLAVSLCSLPLNLKELLWEIWAWPPLQSLRIIGTSHEGYNLYYVRSLLNVASAVLLYFITVFSITSLRGVPTTAVVAKLALPSMPSEPCLPPGSQVANYPGRNDTDFTEIFKSTAVIAVITIIFGFLFLYNVVPHGGRYLSLSLVGGQADAMTAFAYNRGYLGQYLIVTFPLIALFLSGWKSHKTLSFVFFLMAVVSISAIALTYQRGPVVALIFQLLLFSVLYWYVSGRTRRSFFQCIGIIIGIIVISLITDRIFLHSKGLHRLLATKFGGSRLGLLKVSWQMFVNNPLLGIGIGKYHYFFPQYCELAEIPWRKLAYIRSTAHNVYLHLLSEQGIIGLGCFILLIGKIFRDAFRKLRDMTKKQKSAGIAITVSLCGWLTFGLSQNMFYLRSMQIFFWIMLSFLAVILRSYTQQPRISKKTLIITIVCILSLFSYRVFTVTKYPFPHKYYVGFHNWEVQPDGTKAHWIGKRAAMRIPVEGKELTLKCKATFPDMNLKPQKVYISTGEGYSKEVVLSSKDCVQIKIPSEKQAGKFIWVKFKTDYVIIPVKEGWSKDPRMLGAMIYDANWEE